MQMREKVEGIKKNGIGDVVFSSYIALKRGVASSIFYKTNILSEMFMPNCGQWWCETLPHSYA